MVATLLRLRALGLANGVVRRRTGAQLAALVIGALLVLLALIGLILLVRDAAATTPELRNAEFVTVGSLVVLAFWLVPFAFRADDGLAPRAFQQFPVRPRPLAWGLALAALASVPSALLVLLLVGYVVAWSRAGWPAGLAAGGSALLLLFVAVVGGLVAAGLARRGIVPRNVFGTVVLALVAIAAPLTALLAVLDWAAYGVTELRRVAAVLAWTPLGAGWGIPGDVALGRTTAGWTHLAILVVAAAVLWLGWEGIVRRAVTTAELRARERERIGLGVFDALPDTQTGAIAARSVSYWLRDSRYVVPLLILPVIPAVIVAAFWLAGVPWLAIIWIPVPIVCLLIGWGVHNDVAADGTAFWLHVVTSVRGRADRWGRVVAPLVLGVVVAVAGGLVTAMLYGRPDFALPLIALSVCGLGVALGVGSVASVAAPYATSAPGEGPFARPQGAVGGEGAKQAVSLAVSVLLCAPAVALLAVALIVDGSLMRAAVWVAFGLGAVVLVAGVELGALVMRRRAPEILAFTQRN